MADAADALLRVQVCHALADSAFLETLMLPAGSTIAAAIEASGLPARFPAWDVSQAKVGIFGKLKTPDTLVRDGDRVEIYRPLQADPKETRRRRAKHREGVKKDAV